MNKELEEKANKLLKSLYKSVKKVSKKNAIDDVLDSNNVAEMSPDSVAADTANVMAKNKGKKACDCDSCECEGPEEEIDVQKSEQFIGNIMENFKMISDIYLEKKEVLEKNRMATNQEMQPVRDKKQSNKLHSKWDKENKAYQEHQEKIKDTKLDTEHPPIGGEKTTRIKNMPGSSTKETKVSYPKMAASEKVK